jgi:septum formation protein
VVELVLASASPARLKTLRAAGFDPRVEISGVDETAVLAAALAAAPGLAPAAQVFALAAAKARDVAARCPGAVVVGCDSMLELDGETLGKPDGPQDAFRRIRQQAGRQAVLHTGHHVVDTRGPVWAEAGDTASATVRFGKMSDAEIAAYVATGEPLAVAGAFTIDGLGGPFIDGIDGDPHAVVGLSLPLFRELLGRLGLSVPQLWRAGLGG